MDVACVVPVGNTMPVSVATTVSLMRGVGVLVFMKDVLVTTAVVGKGSHVGQSPEQVGQIWDAQSVGKISSISIGMAVHAVSYTHLRAHET